MSMHTRAKPAETNDEAAAPATVTANHPDTFAEDGTRIVLNGHVWVSPERMHGEPCFNGTRIPVQTLFDHLEDPNGLEQFLVGFPSVTRAEAIDTMYTVAAELLAQYRIE